MTSPTAYFLIDGTARSFDADTGEFSESGTHRSMAFECIMETTEERASEVTEHNVEEGAAIVDHVRPKQDLVGLEVRVSNTPMDWDDPNGIAAQYGATQQTIDLDDGRNPALAGVKATVFGFTQDRNVLADTVAALDELRLGGVRFDVATRTGYYSGMVIEKATIKRTAKNGKGGDISISLRRIRVVSSQTVASPKPKEPRGQLKTSKGEQHPVPASGPKTSGLALITDALPDWMKF